MIVTVFYGTSDEIGKSWRQMILAQPQRIYSEVSYILPQIPSNEKGVSGCNSSQQIQQEETNFIRAVLGECVCQFLRKA